MQACMYVYAYMYVGRQACMYVYMSCTQVKEYIDNDNIIETCIPAYSHVCTTQALVYTRAHIYIYICIDRFIFIFID